MKYWERPFTGGVKEYAADDGPAGYWSVVVPAFPAAAYRMPEYSPAPFNPKIVGWKASEEKTVTQAFQNAWLFMHERWPVALMPPTRVKACACGCGKPAIDGSIYAEPKRCKVRACRAGKTKQKPSANAASFIFFVINTDWFDLVCTREPLAIRWQINRRVDRGQRSATAGGFVDFNCYQIVDAADVYSTCMELLGCIAQIDYRAVELPTLAWNAMQHFALSPDKQLVSDDPAAAKIWMKDANRRLNKAEKLMPVKHGNVDKFLAILLDPPKEPKLSGEALAIYNQVLHFVTERPDRTARMISRAVFGDALLDEVRVALNCLAMEKKVARQKRGGDFYYAPPGYYSTTVETK